jgi:hypothetical protein
MRISFDVTADGQLLELPDGCFPMHICAGADMHRELILTSFVGRKVGLEM